MIFRVCIVGFFLVLCGTFALECPKVLQQEFEEMAEKCRVDDVNLDSEERLSRSRCQFLTECEVELSDYMTNCGNEETNPRIQRIISNVEHQKKAGCDNSVKLNVHKVTETKPEETPELATLLCLQDRIKIMTHVKSCKDDINSEGMLTSSNAEDRCSTFVLIANCTTDKVGNDCGESIKEPFHYGMMLGQMMIDMDAALSPQCMTLMRALKEKVVDNGPLKHGRFRRSLPLGHFKHYASLKK